MQHQFVLYMFGGGRITVPARDLKTACTQAQLTDHNGSIHNLIAYRRDDEGRVPVAGTAQCRCRLAVEEERACAHDLQALGLIKIEF